MFDSILERLTKTLDRSGLDPITLVSCLDDHARVFIAGAGRSGLVARCFGMRLSHMGKTVSIVGETTAPPITKDDLLVIISRSAATKTLIPVVEKAKAVGAKTAVITSAAEGRITTMSDWKFLIEPTESDTVLPLGSGFELCALIFLEAVVASYGLRHDVTVSDMQARHANLE